MNHQPSTVNIKRIAESLWHRDAISGMANNQQSILSAREASGENAQSESNGKDLDHCLTMQLLTDFGTQQTFPLKFKYIPAELRLQIWDDRVAAVKGQIISLTTIIAIAVTEPMTGMESKTLQNHRHARFSVRSVLNCQLAHICFEAREVYLKTYKPLFGGREGYPIIYANLEKDAIHWGPNFSMLELRAFTRSVDPTQIRRLILEYNHGISLTLGRTLNDILEICLLFPRLKVITIIPCAGLGLGENPLDRLIKTNDQSNQKSQWVVRLIKPSRNPAQSGQAVGANPGRKKSRECFLFSSADFRKK